MTLFERATELATHAHRGQKRKYSGDPYIVHPLRVAELVRRLGFHENYQAVAVLHDVIEDTAGTLDEIAELDNEVGQEIAMLVMWLTNPKIDLRGRARRFLRTSWMHERVARAPTMVRLIKLLDRYDNIRDLPADDDFFPKYCRESVDLVDKIARTWDRDHSVAEAIAESILRIANGKTLGDKNVTDPAIEALFI